MIHQSPARLYKGEITLQVYVYIRRQQNTGRYFSAYSMEYQNFILGIFQGSLFGSNFFLLYINDLPRDILRSFVNINAEDITVHRPTKIQNNRAWKMILTTCCTPRNKPESFPDHQSDRNFLQAR